MAHQSAISQASKCTPTLSTTAPFSQTHASSVSAFGAYETPRSSKPPPIQSQSTQPGLLPPYDQSIDQWRRFITFLENEPQSPHNQEDQPPVAF